MAHCYSHRNVVAFMASLCSTFALAQGEPLTINTQVNPPYSASYVDYFTSGTQVVITINNTSTEQRAVYLAGSLATLDGSTSASVAGGTPWNAPPLDVPPGSHQFTGADLQPEVQVIGEANEP